jgi:hypothetical protein
MVVFLEWGVAAPVGDEGNILQVRWCENNLILHNGRAILIGICGKCMSWQCASFAGNADIRKLKQLDGKYIPNCKICINAMS